MRYTHFGVKFSTAFKLPVLTAVNIDGENSTRIKRGRDKWFFDGRIDKNFQHGQKAYKDEEIDRGHMVRREDPNWGDDAPQADDDTFHYTNAAPQHSRLNQGKQLWQGLENYILDSARTHGFKACVFTAPVFTDDDPIARGGECPRAAGVLEGGRHGGQRTQQAPRDSLPPEPGSDDPQAVGRSRSLGSGRGLRSRAYRTFQISLTDLEDATGYDFGALKDADPLGQSNTGGPGSGRSERPRRASA